MNLPATAKSDEGNASKSWLQFNIKPAQNVDNLIGTMSGSTETRMVQQFLVQEL